MMKADERITFTGVGRRGRGRRYLAQRRRSMTPPPIVPIAVTPSRPSWAPLWDSQPSPSLVFVWVFARALAAPRGVLGVSGVGCVADALAVTAPSGCSDVLGEVCGVADWVVAEPPAGWAGRIGVIAWTLRDPRVAVDRAGRTGDLTLTELGWATYSSS